VISIQTGYIKEPTTYFFKNATGSARHYTLIYGEEVQYEPPANDDKTRIKIRNRTREGYIKNFPLFQAPVLEVYFIDVGQGDSTFIVTPGRKKILIDGGINNQALKFLSWKYRLQDYGPGDALFIDLMLLSHADDDHLKGLISMLKNSKFKVGKIRHNGIATYKAGVYETELGDRTPDKKLLVTRHDKLDELKDNEISDTFLEWKKAIQTNVNVDYDSVKAYQLIDIESGLKLEILGPRTEPGTNGQNSCLPWFTDEANTINGNSVILKVTYGSFSFLFPGDVNTKGSKHLLNDLTLKPKYDSHVLKAPHHGSHHYHPPFLEQVNPQLTVISSGEENTYGHPRGNFIGTVGRAARPQSLIFATQIAGKFKDTDENLRENLDLSDKEWKALDSNSLEKLRKQFKRRLHGMINVRTDGNKLVAARRIKTAHGWEYYGDITPSSRSHSS
jgi:competence protein ComEC